MIELKEYIGKTDFASLSTLVKTLDERIFRVIDTPISSRVHHTWFNAGILYDLPNRGGIKPIKTQSKDQKMKTREWASFSLIGYLWLQCVSYLRAFGMPLEDIKVYRAALCKAISYEDVTKLSGGITPLDSLKEILQNSNMPPDELLGLLSELESNNIIKTMWSGNTTLFATLVCQTITESSDFILDLYDQGLVSIPTRNGGALFLGPEVDKRIKNNTSSQFLAELPEKLRYAPFFRLSITGFLLRFLTDGSKAAFLERAGLLSAEEQEVISALRSGNAKSVTVQYYNASDSNKENFFIEYKRSGVVKQEDYQKITSALFTHKHVSIKIKKDNGSTFTYETTSRKKIKK